MRCRARRVAHVVQAVEKGDEIEILFRIILGRPDLEAGIRRDIVRSGVRSRVLDRARVEVVTDKLRVRKRLRHDYGGQALTAPDIGYPAAALELFDDAVQRRQPVAHQIVQVAGAEKLRYRAEEAARLVTPSHAAARLERRLHPREIVE